MLRQFFLHTKPIRFLDSGANIRDYFENFVFSKTQLSVLRHMKLLELGFSELHRRKIRFLELGFLELHGRKIDSSFTLFSAIFLQFSSYLFDSNQFPPPWHQFKLLDGRICS